MNFRILALTLSLPWLAGACGDDDPQHHADAATVNCELETRADDYVAGLEKVGAGGVKVALVESVPAPPAKGDNTWQLSVVDNADTPLEGLTLEVTPNMPDHGHGTPVEAVVTAGAEAGQYEAGPVNLWMPGLWEVTVSVSDGADVNDEVVFSFCIEG